MQRVPSRCGYVLHGAHENHEVVLPGATQTLRMRARSKAVRRKKKNVIFSSIFPRHV